MNWKKTVMEIVVSKKGPGPIEYNPDAGIVVDVTAMNTADKIIFSTAAISTVLIPVVSAGVFLKGYKTNKKLRVRIAELKKEKTNG